MCLRFIIPCVGSAETRRQRLFAFKLRRWEYTADGLRGSSPMYPASESSLQCLGKSGP
jgi:hypothetical protein